jgi:hypothetical protein
MLAVQRHHPNPLASEHHQSEAILEESRSAAGRRNGKVEIRFTGRA